MSNFTSEFLRHEARIVWLQDPTLLPCVREAMAMGSRRRGLITTGYQRDGRIVVGYAELKPDAESLGLGRFMRRVFYLMPRDCALAPNGTNRHGAPEEAVDPTTVFPGVPGRTTRAAWEGAGK